MDTVLFIDRCTTDNIITSWMYTYSEMVMDCIIIQEYPTILTPENIWIIGITQEPSTREYYLVFYYDVHALLNSFIRNHLRVKYIEYSDFYELNEIGSGTYATVYTAKYKNYLQEHINIPQTVVLK